MNVPITNGTALMNKIALRAKNRRKNRYSTFSPGPLVEIHNFFDRNDAPNVLFVFPLLYNLLFSLSIVLSIHKGFLCVF